MLLRSRMNDDNFHNTNVGFYIHWLMVGSKELLLRKDTQRHAQREEFLPMENGNEKNKQPEWQD